MNEASILAIRADNYEKSTVEPVIAEICDRLKLSDKIKKGMRVFVKVNLVRELPPENAATTHPSIVSALCSELKSLGAIVIVGDSCGGLYTQKHMNAVYKTTGMTMACEESEASLNDDFTSETVFCQDAEVLKSMQITSSFLNADVVINVAKLKTHGLTGYSGAVKNLFGLIPGLVKVEMHSKFNTLESFCNCLIDIERFASKKIALNIIDGIVGMEGEGPTNGNPVKLGVVIASENAYLADVAAMSIFMDAENGPVMRCAEKRGIINISSEGFKKAVEIGSVYKKKDFKKVDIIMNPSFFVDMPAFLKVLFKNSLSRKVKIIKERCIGCGKCKVHCPGKAIEIIDRKAHIEQKKCIRCYCCQELCPQNAVAFRKALLYGVVYRLSGKRSKK